MGLAACLDCKRKFLSAPESIAWALSTCSVTIVGGRFHGSGASSNSGGSHREPRWNRQLKGVDDPKDLVLFGNAEFSRLRGCRGVLKPDITFFGEKIHPRVWKTLTNDARRADLVIVVGTSLQVKPLSQALALFSPSVPTVLVNKNSVHAPSARQFDYEFLGSCDRLFSAAKNQLRW